ncbi:TPA: hypothetical protein ACTZ5S_003769 [Bacillus cereus]
MKNCLSDWHKPTTKGIKVRLHPLQRQAILDYKNELVSQFRDADDFLDSGALQIYPHGKERIQERVEGKDIEKTILTNSPLDPDAYLDIAQAIMDSQTVEKDAHWKAYPFLTYSFTHNIGQSLYTISVNFQNGIIVVTVFPKHKVGFNMMNHSENTMKLEALKQRLKR